LSVDLLITDRFDIKAIDYANEHGIPVIARDFEQICGNSKLAKKSKYRSEKYYKCSINFHNTILDEITIIEQKRGYKFDLAVLSYYRWIHGKLLEYFDGRMINQHPADLSILGDDGKRKYIGINPAYLSILDGNKKTRTSTILVRNGHDTGEILCQGPWCTYTYEKISKENAALHELKQELISDVPSLVYTLYGISKGHFSIGRDCHTDGCKVIFHCDMPLPYSGYELELEKHLTLMSKVSLDKRSGNHAL
jgi:phosphoribosylglycinamide formyltransferase-1